MDAAGKIYVAGHGGMVGSAILRLLRARGHSDIVVRTRAELDLRDAAAVRDFLSRERPTRVFLAAARVGGIAENAAHPAEFLVENLAIQCNVIDAAYRSGAKKLCFLGSSCVYPRECPQPMREEYLLTGPLEPTNEGYALAKIAGLKMAEYYHRQYGFLAICPMPCNLYGTNDSFDPERSHVLSALVRRFADAAREGLESVTLWGTGAARREFMHVDDCASAVVALMDRWESPRIVNVGWGTDVTIRELAELVAREAGFRGAVEWDPRRPDGMPRKCLDVSVTRGLGIAPRISLEEGVRMMLREYREVASRGGVSREEEVRR